MKEKVLGQVVRDNTRRIENSIIFRSNPNCLKSKVVKEYISENFTTCKSLCNLQELYTAFKEKHPNVNIGFSRFYAQRPKQCALAGSKMTHSACVCSAHQNVVLLVNAMFSDLTYKDMIKLTLSCLKYSIRNYLRSLLYHRHPQEYFFNWNIMSSPYLEMLLISMIKLLFLSFLLIAMFDVASCNQWRL